MNVSAFVWTSLGLNQGPPDYESVALTNWATSPIVQNGVCGGKIRVFPPSSQIFAGVFEIRPACFRQAGRICEGMRQEWILKQ